MFLCAIGFLLHNLGSTKEIKINFSYLNFFFYPIMPMIRLDWKFTLLGIIIVLSAVIVSTLSANLPLLKVFVILPYALFMGNKYNKIYIKSLLKKGFIPADKYSQRAIETRI